MKKPNATPWSSDRQESSSSHLQSELLSIDRVEDSNHAFIALPTSRDLNGLFFEGLKIRESFQIYFEKFASTVPILSPALSADQYYERSPLLFWCIMTVAIRKSSVNREIMVELSTRTMSLAMASMNIASLHVVEGLLIILTWWLLSANSIIEIPAVQAGALLHLAMHMGLHNPVRSQDYARSKLDLNSIDIAHRAMLWNYTVILYQKYWSTTGVPCNVFNDIGSNDQNVIIALPASLQYQRLLFNTMTPILTSLGVESQNSENGSVAVNIDPLIKLGESMLMKLKPDEELLYPSVDELHWLSCRMMIHSSHLHQSLPQPNELTLRLFDLATSYLHTTQKMKQKMPNFEPQITTFIIQAMKIAVFTLVALVSNSSFANIINVLNVKPLIFYGISQLEDAELGKIGVDWTKRMTILVQRLMASKSAFRNEKGEQTLELRIKTRGPSSVVYDTVWWARQELVGMPRVYVGNQPGYMKSKDVELSGSAVSGRLGETDKAQTQPQLRIINNEEERQTSPIANGQIDMENDFVLNDAIFSDIDWSFLLDTA